MSPLLRCTQTFLKNDIVLIMALPQESQNHFENAGIEVHYSGIGKINAAALATELILHKKPRHILNLGTAGSKDFARGSLVECTRFVQRDMNLTMLGSPMGHNPFEKHNNVIEVPSFFSELPKGICGTGDLIESFPTKVHCSVVDMEAYAIAKICKKWNIGFTAIKYITDGSDENMKEDFFQSLEKAAKALLPVYQSLLFGRNFGPDFEHLS